MLMSQGHCTQLPVQQPDVGSDQGRILMRIGSTSLILEIHWNPWDML